MIHVQTLWPEIDLLREFLLLLSAEGAGNLFLDNEYDFEITFLTIWTTMMEKEKKSGAAFFLEVWIQDHRLHDIRSHCKEVSQKYGAPFNN